MTDDTTPAAPEANEPSEVDGDFGSAALTPEEVDDLLAAEPSPLVISYSGQDFDIAGLVRRLNQEDILIPIFGHADARIAAAGFQRSFVWTRPQMDRFIESLLLGYPIPGIFLVRQTDRRYLVLDGQQRLRTLQFFYDGTYEGKEFALQNVGTQLKGVKYKTLTAEQRRLLDDAFIQATIVATDGTSDSLEAIYQLFERLNSGGTQLTPHEIRVALFAGEFIDFLEGLNGNNAWRSLFGKRSPRLRDQELLLRIVALFMNAEGYRRPLKTFLNQFVAAHRDLSNFDAPKIAGLFATASASLESAVGRRALRREGNQLNAALAEAVYVGLMRRIVEVGLVEDANVEAAIATIRRNADLQFAISRATADEENVKTRLQIATDAFAEV